VVVHGRLLFVHGVKSRDGRRVLTGESYESHVGQHANFGAVAIVSLLYRSLIFFGWLVS
jgi:hypothetical protein